MNRKIILLLLVVFVAFISAKSDHPAYRLFTGKGKITDYKDLLKEAEKADVIFFGEMHDNPICHWLELELAKDLYEVKKQSLVIGSEIFERDNQLLLNEYISGMIRKKDFEAEAKLWKNYGTDYAPLVDFAHDNKIKFVATSIPRRFAAIVNLKGFEGLDSINAVERGMMAPLPVKYNPQLACYRDMIANMGDAGASHAGVNIQKAQAIKDATMAHFILKNGTEGITFLHINGSYHSDRYEGIVWFLRKYNQKNETDLKILTISSVEQESIDDLGEKNKGLADFIICIPDDMTKTQVPSFGAGPLPAAMVPGAAAGISVKADTVAEPADTSDIEVEGDDD
jgi:uncharacterized iron-regulated protein